MYSLAGGIFVKIALLLKTLVANISGASVEALESKFIIECFDSIDLDKDAGFETKDECRLVVAVFFVAGAGGREFEVVVIGNKKLEVEITIESQDYRFVGASFINFAVVEGSKSEKIKSGNKEVATSVVVVAGCFKATKVLNKGQAGRFGSHSAAFV